MLAAEPRPGPLHPHPPRAGPWARTERESGTVLSVRGVEAWMARRQPGRHSTSPPLVPGVAGLLGPLKPDPCVSGLRPCCHPKPLPSSPAESQTSLHIGYRGWAQHTNWFRAANSPNNSWLRLPEFRPRIPAARWRGGRMPFRLHSSHGRPGQGVWRGRGHAPAPSAPRLSIVTIGGEWPVSPVDQNPGRGGLREKPAPSQLSRCFSTSLPGEGPGGGKMLEANSGNPTCVEGIQGR